MIPARSQHPLVDGRFRLIRTLGQGGMGTIYEVLHELTGHRRALKLLTCSTDQQNVIRFFREASAASRIADPHVLEVYDAGCLASGQAYILMELLEGRTLASHLHEAENAKLAQLVELALQVCSALASAHDAGVVHRDIKPANLFVLERNGAAFVKILDFGKHDRTFHWPSRRSSSGRWPASVRDVSARRVRSPRRCAAL